MVFKKIGFFGGTFDPIHNGHLNLALSLSEMEELDEVLFCPAFLAPQKTGCLPEGSSQHRWQMVQLAIEGIPGFKAIDIELQRPPPSFTIDTILQLRKIIGCQEDEVIFYLILGQDMMETLGEWKEIEQLFSLTTPLVGSRLVDKTSLDRFAPFLREKLNRGCRSIPVMEISSSVIRRRMREKKCCRHLVPGKVLDYIYLHRLYCS